MMQPQMYAPQQQQQMYAPQQQPQMYVQQQQPQMYAQQQPQMYAQQPVFEATNPMAGYPNPGEQQFKQFQQ